MRKKNEENQKISFLAQNPELVDIEHFARLESMVEQISKECFSLSTLAINGSDLVSAGFEKGRGIGEILNTLLDEVIENKLPNEKNALLERAKEMK